MKILVCGAGGFIGNHLVGRLKKQGHWVRGADLKYPEFSKTEADEFIISDLRNYDNCCWNTFGMDVVYQLAADMGGAGYVFTGDNDADIMRNSATINLNILHNCLENNVKKIFYSSSACIYPEYNQVDPDDPHCRESDAYPAQPDSEYGWEKLFSERLYLAYQKNYGLDVKIARYHNIFGQEGTWTGGREKAPAAICRKVAENDVSIEIWGDGSQTRSFLYIDDCIDATLALMNSDCKEPINIGSEEMVTINELVDIVVEISGKNLNRYYDTTMPQGVRGRTSFNKLIERYTGWKPKLTLREGLELTYKWIEEQIDGI